MLKKICGLILLALSAACSGSDEEPEAYEELDELEQEFIALNSANKQFGSQTGSPHRSANKTSTGQVVSIPRFKKIQVVRDDTGTWTEVQRVNMQSVVGALDAKYTDWDFSIVNYTAPADPNAVRVFVTNQTVSGSAGSNIDLYSDIAFGGTVQLTEGQNGGLPKGQYQSHASCDLKIDRDKTMGKGSTTLEDGRMMHHVFGNGIVVCMGVGTNDTANGQYSQRPIDLTQFLGAGTNGEACRASVAINNTTDFSIQTASACAGD